MRILLVGVSYFGKTTIGTDLAWRLGCAVFDLDAEIESHFGTSIQRLQARFLTDIFYRKEYTVVLKGIAMKSPNCSIACRTQWSSRLCSANTLCTVTLTQLVSDSFLAPAWIVNRHLANQCLKRDRNSWSTRTALVAPEQSKTRSLPPNECPWHHDRQRIPPVEPSREHHQC